MCYFNLSRSYHKSTVYCRAMLQLYLAQVCFIHSAQTGSILCEFVTRHFCKLGLHILVLPNNKHSKQAAVFSLSVTLNIFRIHQRCLIDLENWKINLFVVFCGL